MILSACNLVIFKEYGGLLALELAVVSDTCLLDFGVARLVLEDVGQLLLLDHGQRVGFLHLRGILFELEFIC